jgi:hypothetical protein
MNLPSVEFMMIAARGIVLLLALATLAWAILRWRRDTTRDAQRMFEQLDLVRAELLQLQSQVHVAPPAPSAIAQYQTHQSIAPVNYAPATPAMRTSYPDFEAERKVITESRRPASETVKPKNLTNAAPRGYEVASRLARSGATVEELVNTCALSRNEAELMVRLHAGMKSTQPPSTRQQTASSSDSRAHANLNQLKNIGSRATAAPAKPAAQNAIRPNTSARPANHQRVSLVG